MASYQQLGHTGRVDLMLKLIYTARQVADSDYFLHHPYGNSEIIAAVMADKSYTNYFTFKPRPANGLAWYEELFVDSPVGEFLFRPSSEEETDEFGSSKQVFMNRAAMLHIAPQLIGTAGVLQRTLIQHSHAVKDHLKGLLNRKGVIHLTADSSVE